MPRRYGEPVILETRIGSTYLRGQRISSVTIESWEEIRDLLSPNGLQWAADNLVPAMLTKMQQEEI